MPVPRTYNELGAPGDGELWVSLVRIVLIAAALACRVAPADHHKLLSRTQALSVGLLKLRLAHEALMIRVVANRKWHCR